MGITVILEDERGNRLESIIDPPNLFSRLLPGPHDTSFLMLRFIDPYGDTVFNRLQMDTFIQEWDRIARHAQTEEEGSFLSRVRELAVRCQNEIHEYLKFYGD